MEEENKKEAQKEESSKETNEKKEESSNEKHTGMAALAYVFFLIPLLTGYKKDDYVMYHVRQGTVLFFTGVILTAIPFIGWLLNVGVFILFVMGVNNALNGKKEQLPLIGHFGKKIKF